MSEDPKMHADRLADVAKVEHLFNVTFNEAQIQAYLDGRITIRQLVWAILSPGSSCA